MAQESFKGCKGILIIFTLGDIAAKNLNVSRIFHVINFVLFEGLINANSSHLSFLFVMREQYLLLFH